jgi:hypothetical protein
MEKFRKSLRASNHKILVRDNLARAVQTLGMDMSKPGSISH